MKKNNFFFILKNYLKNRLPVILLFILIFAVFMFICYLNNIIYNPIIYAFDLSAVFVLLYLIIDFCFYYKKHNDLMNLLNHVNVDISDLPAKGTLIEKDYQLLLKTLYDEKAKATLMYDQKVSEQNDYYTLWAHQIKTPISAMRLIIQSESDDNGALEQELFKIEQYVEMVLHYLRLESISSDLLLKEYSLDEIVKQAVKKYSPLFIGKKISLNLSDLNCKVLTDEKWLCFVIEQILSNSLKYTGKGSISIYMDEGNGKALVIEDTGIGIKEEDISRIFERGFTGYNGRMDKKSTGIGLYLVKKILKRLSHEIKVESEVGKGTKVKVIFEEYLK